MRDSDPDKHKWFHDYVSPNITISYRVKELIYLGKTKFQSIAIIDNASFGKCLVLDGKIQSSEADEFIYHEALVHPAMVTHPNPEKVFIAGGGEGATLREVLAHNTVKKAVMVDIDEEVVDICHRFLSSWHQNSFDAQRVELHFTDAREYFEKTTINLMSLSLTCLTL
jgi:spermidine synthase